MKPLDLERFEELESQRGRVLSLYRAQSGDTSWQGQMMRAYDLKHGIEYRQIAIDAIAELKALRAWQASVKAAHDAYYAALHNNNDGSEPHALAYQRFVQAWLEADEELNNEIQSNNRS
jgi:hypothetical protein